MHNEVENQHENPSHIKLKRSRLHTYKIPLVLGFFTLLGLFTTLFLLSQDQQRETRSRAQTSNVLTYYVDCSAGSDSNSGRSQSTAWRSISKANNATLNPGDKLLFKRGCTWEGTLNAKWVGRDLNGDGNVSEAEHVLIGAYGSGELPRMNYNANFNRSQFNVNVNISGSYQIIEYLHANAYNHYTDPGCRNQRVANIYGFNFKQHAHHNIIQHSKATNLAAGVHFSGNTSMPLNTLPHHNKVLRNTLTNNGVMTHLTNDGVYDDIGAWGINLKGLDNEVAYNYLKDNNGVCAYDSEGSASAAGFQGNTIELFIAKRNTIHHNIAINDRTFSEIGGDRVNKDYNSVDNTFAYNLYYTAVPYSRFIVIHGLDTVFGPTRNIKLYNNTVYLTHANGEGVVCSGCDPTVLKMKNNIIWANGKVIYAGGGDPEEQYNIFWSTNGAPFLQGITKHNTSQISNPRFIDAATDNFRLLSTAPGINRGTSESVSNGWNRDLDDATTPASTGVDIGAYEFGSSSTQPTTTTQPSTVPTATIQPSPTNTSATPVPNTNPTIVYSFGDTYASEESPTRNYGSVQVLESDGMPSRKISYLKFDLTPYSNMTISSAVFRFYVRSGSTSTYQLKYTDHFAEYDLTYNNRPSLRTTFATVGTTQKGRWYDVDVTAAVRSRLGNRLFFGIESTEIDGLDIASREDASYQPRLILSN